MNCIVKFYYLFGTPKRILTDLGALCKLVGEKPDTWDNYPDSVTFVLRTRKHLSTKFSPFFLMFGTEARYLCEVPDDYKIDKNKDIIEEEVLSEDIQQQDEIFYIA